MVEGKTKFRDVYWVLQKIRNFLIGREPHQPHNRFPPRLAPRTLPAPDIPRGPCFLTYSNYYYYNRSALNSVKPPVVAPIALGLTKKSPAAKGDTEIVFPTIPAPGCAYWWDGHYYFEEVPDKPKCPPMRTMPTTPPSPPPCPPSSQQPPSHGGPCGPCDPCGGR